MKEFFPTAKHNSRSSSLLMTIWVNVNKLMTGIGDIKN